MATAAALVASLRSQSALETLLKVVSNILKAPTEPKYRTLKTSNAKISVITEASGGTELLRALGFEAEAGTLVLPMGADLNVLMDVQRAITEALAAPEARWGIKEGE